MRSAHVAQSVERILGKDEVHRFDPGRGLHFIVVIKADNVRVALETHRYAFLRRE